MEIEKLIDDIEREIYELNREEVNSSDVGEIVIKKLEQIDGVAYIRFAAVYRKFRDLETFDKEIKRMIDKEKDIKVNK